MKTCEDCLHIAVCGRYAATGGHVRECKHFATDNIVGHKWIPTAERLPDTFGVFIVAIREPCKERVGKDCADFDPFDKTWLPSMCWDNGHEITHWMPLPEPPKEVE